MRKHIIFTFSEGDKIKKPIDNLKENSMKCDVTHGRFGVGYPSLYTLAKDKNSPRPLNRRFRCIR